MDIQVEFWDLVTLLVSFFGFAGAGGKLLLSQIDRRLEDRFQMVEHARNDWSALERQFLEFKAELPVQYVRREDYVRGQSVIEAKLDALYNKLEVVQMKEIHHV